MGHDTPSETVRFVAADGVELEGDLAVPAGATVGAVVCHPHPRYGGDRRVPVVDALFRALVDAGVATLRFDFRGVGASSGEFGEGVDERLDVGAALNRLGEEVEGRRWLVGYSFGADVALSVDGDRVAGWVAVAPPLGVVAHAAPAGADERLTLVLSPAHDQFRPPASAREVCARWTGTSVEEVAMADHLLGGRLDVVAARVVAAVTA
ncbi:MAG TPA: alpha/beta hydrolase [Acidimicrobiales bacterium]|nr:alpha/beta hydrolase [Acidimicrobiales bacterium]